MAFSWGEFLDFANSLNNSADQDFIEARKRSVVSRAYFAAFLIARDYAIEKKMIPPPNENENVHRKVIHAFINSGKKPQVGRRLMTLRGWRNQCDYDLQTRNISSLAINSLKEAKDIIDLINSK